VTGAPPAGRTTGQRTDDNRNDNEGSP
jgi:hypothetical protein